ncbi:MAG: DHA2 family efflux MFS transporter permease subunit, partial [Polyangiaceae bacterium]
MTRSNRREPAASSPRWALVTAVLGSGMAFLDGSVVNVALPVIQRELAIGVDLVQWIVEAYLLLLASLVLVGGVLGDRYGRRRVFVAGVVVFATASAGCGLAPGAMFLIVARAVQGLGAALLVPGSLALISAAYGDSRARGAAIGTWSASSAVLGALGPVAGGWVVAHASWRWLFFFNVPIAALVTLVATARVTETRDETAGGRADVRGASLVTVALGLLVYGLVEAGNPGGPARPSVVVSLVAGGVLAAAFVVVEARTSSPMVPLSLFRSRTFSGANLLTLLLYGALGGGLFFLPFDLIQVQRYSPAAAGASLLPLVLIIAAMSRWIGALSGRIGARGPLIVGPLVASAGFALLARPSIGGTYWGTFFPAVVVLGVGMGITVAPLTAAVMGAVDARHAGLASGINNAVARAAALLAVASLGLVLVARFDARLDERLAAMDLPPAITQIVAAERTKLAAAELPPDLAPAVAGPLRDAIDDAYVAAFRLSMLVCAVLAALAALAAMVLVSPASAPPPASI